MTTTLSTPIAELATLPPEELSAFLATLTDDEALTLLQDWRLWARPKQLPPPGAWRLWMIMSGRGSGKTRTGAEWMHEQARVTTTGRLFLLGSTWTDVRETMIEGESGLLATARNSFRPKFELSRGRVVWPNGAQARMFSGEKPNRLRGPQHEAGWADELAAFQYPQQCYDNMMMGLRLGPSPRAIFTTTPKPLPLMVQLVDSATNCEELRAAPADSELLTKEIPVALTTGSSYENRANLAPSWFAEILNQYEGTRLGDQEIHGKLLRNIPGALWNTDLLELHRFKYGQRIPSMSRIVIAIDPAVTSGEKSSETGIIIAGKAVNGHCFIMYDVSGRYTPHGWATKAIEHYRSLHADRIVAEVNNGGDLVKATVHTVDPMIAYKEVRASRGKISRAEPVAALYEQGKVHHVGTFSMLESQMTTYVPDTGQDSPDRMDALVWAVTELMLGKAGAFVV